MAKQSMIQREKKRRELVKKYNKKRSLIKESIKNTNNILEKITFQQQLQQLPKNSAPCRLRNRCWLTGRSRGYYRSFGLSRHMLREMARECLLPGITKSSW